MRQTELMHVLMTVIAICITTAAQRIFTPFWIEEQTSCNVSNACWIGDGWCDDSEPGYNTPECNYDGGDCCEATCNEMDYLDLGRYNCGENGYSCRNPSQVSISPSKLHSLAPTREPTAPLQTQFPSSSSSKFTQTPTRGPMHVNAPAPDQTSTPTPRNRYTESNNPTISPSSMSSQLPATQSTNSPLAPPTNPDSHVPTSTGRPSTALTCAPSQQASSGTWQPTTTFTPECTSQPTPGVSPPIITTTTAPTPSTTVLPTASSTIAPTALMTARPTAASSSTPTALITARPIAASTSIPTASPTIVSTALMTARPIAEPTGTPTALTARPTAARPTVAPTVTPTEPMTVRPTGAPTGIPTALMTVRPTAAPTNNAVNVQYSFLMANTTLPMSFAEWSVTETGVIQSSIATTLSALEFQCIVTVLGANDVSKQHANRHNGVRLLQETIRRLIVWNITVDIAFDTTVLSPASERRAIIYTLNNSLHSGQLQNTMRMISYQLPVANNLFAVVLCSANSVNQCILPIPPAPSASVMQFPCERDTAAWEEWYNMPSKWPWYLVWVLALGVAWVLITIQAAAPCVKHLQQTGECSAQAVWVVVCGVVRTCYLGLLVAEFWSSTLGDGVHSIACAEFSYLEQISAADLSNWTFCSIEILNLLRGLFYPCLLIACCFWMRAQVRNLQHQLECLERSNSPGVVRTAVSSIQLVVCAGVAMMLVLTAATTLTLLQLHGVAEHMPWERFVSQAVQLTCAIIILLITVRFVTAVRSIKRLIFEYILRAGIRQEEDVLSALEAEVQAADVILSPRQHNGSLNRCDVGLITEEAFAGGVVTPKKFHCSESLRGNHATSALTGGAAVIALCVMNALVMVLTASAVALRTPLSALLLYSIGARVLELLLVETILNSIDTDHHSEARQSTRESPIVPEMVGAYANAYLTADQIGAGSSEPTCVVQANKEQMQRKDPALHKVSAFAQKSTSGTRLCQVESAAQGCKNVYNKKWPWIFTPSGDVPAEQEQAPPDAAPSSNAHTVQDGSLRSPAAYHNCRNDSPGDDSTDSGVRYFI